MQGYDQLILVYGIHNMSDGGKGSKQRPTDKQKFDNNWELIFGNKPKETSKEINTGELPDSQNDLHHTRPD